jgi:hypothetical protein
MIILINILFKNPEFAKNKPNNFISYNGLRIEYITTNKIDNKLMLRIVDDIGVMCHQHTLQDVAISLINTGLFIKTEEIQINKINDTDILKFNIWPKLKIIKTNKFKIKKLKNKKVFLINKHIKINDY